MNYEKDLPIDQSESIEGFIRGVDKDGVSVLIPKSNLNSQQHGDIYLGTANVSTVPINESGYWICGENGTYVNFNNQLANKNDRFYWNKNTTNWDLVPNDQALSILNQNKVKQDASFWVENAKASVVEVTADGFYKYDGVNVIMAQKSLHNYYFAGAGSLSNTGQNNIGIGEAALLNNSGDYNIGIGKYSLYFNQGSNNISEGYASLMDLGSAQTAGTFVIGQSYTIQSSGDTNFTLIGAADNNVGTVFTATGAGTGTGTATPNGTDNNTAIGYNTGRGIIYGAGNTILGANVTGLDAGLTNNIILADGSGNQRINVDESGNVGIGTTAPSEKLDVDGSINIADKSAYKYGGVDVITAQTNMNNYFFGSAGNLSNTGNNNFASGYQSLANITGGIQNTAVGNLTLNSTTTGSYNCAFGISSLKSNLTGEHNVAIGDIALQKNTAGSYNTACGSYALVYNTTGNYNTTVGHGAIGYNITGSYNSAVGNYAGYYIADGTNTNSAGDSSVFLGANTKAHADNETNQIVIGFDATGNGSNTVTLGNDDITETFLKGTINFDSLKAKTFRTISTVTDSGNEGEIAFDANYIYVCVGANSWKRITLTTW